MITSLLVGFGMGWVGSMPLAGAVSIFVFHRGLAGWVRRGLVLAAGAALAEAIWCLVAVIGAESILTRWPNLESPARIVGAVILLALGIYFLAKKATLPPLGDGEDANTEEPGTLLKEFSLGFGLVAGNISIPFTWLGMITIAISWGLDPLAGPAWLFSLAVALGIMGWFTLLLKLLTAFRTRIQPTTHERLMKAMGILLLAMGAWTLIRA